jgi:hypothetical protein
VRRLPSAADYHCHVAGQCVADRNFKFFVLSFFWGGASALIMFCPILVLLLDGLPIVPVMNVAYSIAFGIILLVSGASFVWQNYRDVKVLFKFDAKPLTRKKYFALGKTFWEKVMSFHAGKTSLAWPGVDWTDDDLVLL